MCRVWLQLQLAGLRSARSARALAQMITFTPYMRGSSGSHNRALWALSRIAPAMISNIGAKFPTALKMLRAERLRVQRGRGKSMITASPERIQDKPTSKGTK